jgi:SAUR family protein
MGKSVSVQRGHIPVLVGEGKDELQRVLVHSKVLHHPYFAGLLELAAMEFGHDQKGVLRIPCDVRCFHTIVQLIRSSTRRKEVTISIPCLLIPQVVVTFRFQRD